jgi:hypothetical protein
VVKCVDFIRLNENEVLLVSAGGKANIILWKVIFEATGQSGSINRIIQLCEFKRFLNRRRKLNPPPPASSTTTTTTTTTSQSQHSASALSKHEKPWLYVDLKSNPDVRFMDVCIFKLDPANTSEFIMCFACSDGYVRIFQFLLDAAKLYLVNKYAHAKCLLCLRHLTVNGRTHLLGVGTDGNLLFWPLNLTDEGVGCQQIDGVNQSGINDLDVWQNESELIIATVGDDTRISIVGIEFTAEGEWSTRFLIKHSMAHASSVIGKFKNK